MIDIKIISSSQKKKTHQVTVKENGVSKTHHVPFSLFDRWKNLILKTK